MLTRYLRYFLTTLLGLAVLALVVVSLLFFYVSPERVVAKINHVLADAASMEIVLLDEDAASLKRLPELVASFQEGELRFTTGEVAGTFSNLSVTLSPLSIFAEAPRIESISITGFKGRFPSDYFTHANTVQTANLSGEPSDSTEKREATPKEWDIAEFHMEGASITFDGLNAESTATQFLRLENARAEAFALNEKGGTLNVAGTLLSDYYAGEASFSADLLILEDGRFGFSAPSLTLRGLMNQKEVQASFSAASAMAAENSFTFESLRFDAALSNNTTVAARFPALTVNSKGDISSARVAADICIPDSTSSIDLKLRGEIERQAAVSTWRLSNLALESRLAKHQKDTQTVNTMSSMTGSLEASEREGRAALQLSGMFINTPADFDGTVGFGDLARMPQDLCVAGKLSLGRIDPELRAFVSSGTAKAMLRQTKFDLNLSAADLGLIPNVAIALEGSLSTSKGRISWHGMNICVQEGIATLEGTLEENGSFSFSFKAEKIPAANLMRALGFEPSVSGLLSGDVKLAGDVDRTRITAASGHIDIADGLLIGFDIPLAGDLLKREHFAEMPAEITTAQAQTHFDTLAFEVAPFETDNKSLAGNYTFRLIDLNMEGLRWNASGSSIVDATKIHTELTFAFPDVGFLQPAASLVACFEMDAKGAKWTPEWTEAASAINEAPDQSTVERLLMRLRRMLINFWENLDIEMPSFEDFSFEWPTLLEFKIKIPDVSDWLPDVSDFRWPWEDEINPDKGADTAPVDPSGTVI